MRLFSLDFVASMPVAMRRTIATVDCMHNRLAQFSSAHRRILAAVLIGGVVLIAGYYAYWRYVANQLAVGIENWAAEQRALGNKVDFAWGGIGGFPFAFRAAFRQPSLALRLPGADVTWQGADLTAEMSPWNLREIRLSSGSEHNLWLQALQQPGLWRLSTMGLQGRIAFHADGMPREIVAELEQPDATLSDGTAVAAGHAGLGLLLPETPPIDYTQPFAQISLNLSRAVLPQGTLLLTADPVEEAGFDATIRGPLALPLSGATDPSQPQPPSLTQILSAWRDAGGDVEVKHFSFSQGPLTATGEATLALDGDLQLLGAGTVTATGLGDAVEILLGDGRIPADRALVVRTTAKALERTGDDGKKQAKFALSLQDRTISFGPAPLMKLPPIVWP